MKRLRRWGCLGVLLVLVGGCAAQVSAFHQQLVGLSTLAEEDQEHFDAGEGNGDGIPPRMLQAYRSAAGKAGKFAPGCRGMRWPILAGIARIESNHAAGRSVSESGDIRPKIYGPLLDGAGVGGNTTAHPDTDGGRWDGTARGERAVGPFQFIPATWASTAPAGHRDPHNADDAALAAVIYLCGRGRDLRSESQLEAALFQYNRSKVYVADVRRWIDQYSAGGGTGSTNLEGVKGKARTVLETALSQRGVPYSWGGGDAKGKSTGSCCSPSGKSGASIVGFDCSGLTTYAFARAGISLPRTASAQSQRGKRLRTLKQMAPGDLVFFSYIPGQDSAIYHVGIYLGDGKMINAARPGTRVRIDPVASMSGFAGGARLW